MKNQSITVVYQWTAKAGQATQLQSIYAEVKQQMETHEPNALQMDCYFDPQSQTLFVYDLFRDAEALGFHLGTTAPAHFPALLEIANPGPFLFMGDVPAEMQQAALGMGLNATFAPHLFGFERVPA